MNKSHAPTSRSVAFKYAPIFHCVTLLNDTQIAVLISHGNKHLTQAIVELVRCMDHT